MNKKQILEKVGELCDEFEHGEGYDGYVFLAIVSDRKEIHTIGDEPARFEHIYMLSAVTIPMMEKELGIQEARELEMRAKVNPDAGGGE
jgi:hypothetical protein